jgi:type I restriction enzyme S subunit
MKQGWQVKRLGDVCEIIKGRKPALKAASANGYLPYLVAKVMRGSKEAEYASVSDRNSITVDESETIIICDGSNSGEVFTGFRGILSSTMGKIVKKAEIDDDYLRAFLTSTFEVFNGAKTGTAIPHLDKEAMYQLQLPVPPIAEQQRIVGLLDEAFAGLATAKANAEQNLHNARALFESHLNAVFTQRGEGWVERPLAELCYQSRVITYGVIKLGDEVIDGVPCLRTSNVRWLCIDTEGIKRIAPALSSEYSRTILKGGEVLVNVRGTLGGVAVSKSDMAGWNVSREVAVVPVNPAMVNPTFLSYFIGSGTSQHWLGGVKKGAAYIGINIEDLRILPVSFPKMESQLEIVEHLDLLQKATQRLALLYERKLAALEELKQSLLHQAFSGAL